MSQHHTRCSFNALVQVLADMNEVLGPLTPAQQEVVDTIEEIYGCNRMMLAALPKELLAAVCSGNGCDMYEVRAAGMGDKTWDLTHQALVVSAWPEGSFVQIGPT